MEENFSIINKTKSKLPGLPILHIKNEILGKNYSLSLAFISEKESRILNKKYRRKNKPANILSFPLQKNNGEIILCPSVIKKEAVNFEKSFAGFVGFLVIHGMLHLKGLEHSSTMEKREEKYDKKYFSGDRYRIFHDKSRGGRIFKGRKNS